MSDSGATKPESQKQKRDTIVANIKSILFYSLSMTVALAFNDTVKSAFDSFPFTQHIIAKVTYVVILFGLTIFSAYTLGGSKVMDK